MSDLTTAPLEFQFDIHKDCSTCPAYSPYGKCGQVGTGIHEPIEVHLRRVHGFSSDKTAGLALAARLVGKTDTEVFVLAHQAILLFAPRTPETIDVPPEKKAEVLREAARRRPTIGYGPEFDIDKRERHA